MSITLVTLAMASLNILAAITPAMAPAGASLAAPDAAALAGQGDALLVDIRRPEEWQATGRPAGATGITLEDPQFVTKIAEAVRGDRGRPVILICRSGRRTLAGMDVLRAAGFSQVSHIGEGMIGSEHGPGWLNRGLPLDQVAAD